MKKLILALSIFGSVNSFAENSRFYANQNVQAESPTAFALQPEAASFVREVIQITKAEGEILVAAIAADPELLAAIANWEQLSIEEQIPYLRKVFALEYQTLGISPPELQIESGVIPGPAFFEFDPAVPGAGKVILNPAALAEEKNKYSSLALLIHETRHSAQFQMAFQGSPVFETGVLALGYRSSFIAQKAMMGRLSFCDFLTLLNEYEAFLFGNYVLGRLTNWGVDMIDMGTFASQFDAQGALKIDLGQLLLEPSPDSLLDRFNILEKVQYDLLRGQ